MKISVNDEVIDLERYCAYHNRRIDLTLDELRRIGGRRVIELGGHPWAMTARILSDPTFELVATVSAEEVSLWPDAIPVTQREYTMRLPGCDPVRFKNYSANIERTRFEIGTQVDLILACEIIEHLVRAPHIMLLNANSWLRNGGKIFITTPNGAHFENPFRLKSKMPSYRANVYGRHNYVYNMDGLTDLVEACGFEVERAEYVSPYPRYGLSKCYQIAGSLPFKYFNQKFCQSIHLVARKTQSLSMASKLPNVFVPSDDWDAINRNSNSSLTL